MQLRLPATIATVLSLLLVAGCGSDTEQPGDPRQAQAESSVQAKWGKTLAELPTVKLVVISPHNTAIEYEFAEAFSLHHAVEYGQKVDIEWRDIGGGASSILRYLQNVYDNAETSGIDIVWGGGDYYFTKLAAADILQPMELSDDVLANIPAKLGGLDMYDSEHRWCGSAVSGFGFLYNAPLLKQLGRTPPATWDDLGDPRFHDLIGLADPTMSGSAASAYAMVVQSAGNWANGWSKLLGILGNAKKFYDGASSAADAPVSGEVAMAACIDFYGTVRVAKDPEAIVYVSPAGQTAFNPDPIGILKNPPHPKLAQRFTDFVLSRRGQALWAVKVGQPDGPIRTALGRLPIRTDVYTHYESELSQWVINPYQPGAALDLDRELWDVSHSLLRQLVEAAAIKNRQGLKAAKKKLIDTNFDADRLAEFNRLPANVATLAEVAKTAPKLRDPKQGDIIRSEWARFFADKYKRVSE